MSEMHDRLVSSLGALRLNGTVGDPCYTFLLLLEAVEPMYRPSVEPTKEEQAEVDDLEALAWKIAGIAVTYARAKRDGRLSQLAHSKLLDLAERFDALHKEIYE